jgi:hypothetical protein
VDFKVTVVVYEAQTPKFVHEKTYAGPVVPMISASVSWLILVVIGSGAPSFPKLAKKVVSDLLFGN